MVSMFTLRVWCPPEGGRFGLLGREKFRFQGEPSGHQGITNRAGQFKCSVIVRQGGTLKPKATALGSVAVFPVAIGRGRGHLDDTGTIAIGAQGEGVIVFHVCSRLVLPGSTGANVGDSLEPGPIDCSNRCGGSDSLA